MVLGSNPFLWNLFPFVATNRFRLQMDSVSQLNLICNKVNGPRPFYRALFNNSRSQNRTLLWE